MAKSKLLKLDTLLKFGKYRGKYVHEILWNKQYFDWLEENCQYKISDDVRTALLSQKKRVIQILYLSSTLPNGLYEGKKVFEIIDSPLYLNLLEKSGNYKLSEQVLELIEFNKKKKKK